MRALKNFYGCRSGFTLLEVLLALAIFFILLLVTTQFTAGVQLLSSEAGKRLASDAEARLVLDCMANDFAHIVQRTDLDCRFNKTAGNDSFFFYSEIPGYYYPALNSTQNAHVSLVGYRINTANQLERLGKNLTWTGGPSPGVAPGSIVYLNSLSNIWPATTGLNTTTDADFQVLSTSVYRLETNFLLIDGTISTIPITNPTSTTNNLNAANPPTASDDSVRHYSTGSRWYDAAASIGYVCVSAVPNAAVWQTLGLQDVSRMNVGLGVIDPKSKKLITNTLAMINALPDAVNGQTVLQTWGNSTYLTQSGIPAVAASQIRLYQRLLRLK